MTSRLLTALTALVLSSTALATAAAPPDPTVDHRKMHDAEQRLTDTFKGQDNFQIKGTLVLVDSEHGSVVVQRGDLPIAFLIVPETAPVTLDGRKCSLGELQPGTEVRATFNLVQQYPIALQLDGVRAQPGPVPAPQR